MSSNEPHDRHEEDGNPSASGPSSPDADSFAEARAFLACGYDTGEGLPPGDQAAFAYQQELILLWAKQSGQFVPATVFEGLALVSNSTSEHEVRYRIADNRAVKRTWAGFYGQVPAIVSGILGRKLATPLEYLDRMALQNRVFASTFEFEGVNVSEKPSLIIGQPAGMPSLVVSQGWVQAIDPDEPHPADEGIAAFMRQYGFEPVPGSYFGWLRPADGVVVVDAKRDNFILTPEGIVPIDLQMAQLSLDNASGPC